jgi:hypothetical protein
MISPLASCRSSPALWRCPARRRSGSETGHRRFAVEQRVVHVDVDDRRPASDLLAGDLDRFFEFPSRIRRANALLPVTFVRSPIMMKLLSGRSANGSVPLRRSVDRSARLAMRLARRRASAMARCDPAWCRSSRRRCSASRCRRTRDHGGHALRAKIVLPHFVGKPALGWQLMRAGDLRQLFHAAASTRDRARSSSRRRAWEVRDRVPERLDRLARDERPPARSKRAEIITGTRLPVSSKYFSMANRHALRLSVSIDRFGQQQIDARLRPALRSGRSRSRPSR